MNEELKARYWQAIMYPENMIDDWENKICELLQVPFAYCIHTMDTDKKKEKRKIHVHIIIAYGNTTTYKSALRTFKRLEKEGKSAIPNNTIQQVISVRNAYDYLIHDTDDSRKKGKYQYPKDFRILGNNFDIGSYEQLSATQKNEMCKILCNLVILKHYINFCD